VVLTENIQSGVNLGGARAPGPCRAGAGTAYSTTLVEVDIGTFGEVTFGLATNQDANVIVDYRNQYRSAQYQCIEAAL
jgi:hypothetical protein